MILKILKGILVGLGGILPGVSGGMIAASFNVYEELVGALDDFTKKPIKAVINIWEYLVGIVVGVLLGIILITTIFDKFPIPITLLFIGLILGGIPEIKNKLKFKELNYKHYLTMGIMVALMIGLLFLKEVTVANLGFFQYILAGFLIAVSLIVPGLSGTMILLALGIYINIIKDTIKLFINSIFTFDISSALSLSPPIILIGLAAVITLIGLAKPINYLLKNKSNYFNIAVLGILVVSPFNIIWSLYRDVIYGASFNNIGALTIIASLILFIIGLVLALYLAKLANKKQEGLLDEK